VPLLGPFAVVADRLARRQAQHHSVSTRVTLEVIRNHLLNFIEQLASSRNFSIGYSSKNPSSLPLEIACARFLTSSLE
jgi:hypothetical protein